MRFATLMTSAALALAPLSAHAAEVTLEQQTDAVSELFRLRQGDGETPREYHWFLIGQHVSPDGKNAIGYPTYKLFKDEQACKTELSVIKDDPPPILQGRTLSCHPISANESAIDVFSVGRSRAVLPPEGIPPAAHFVYVAANEQTRFYDARGNSVGTATRDSQSTTTFRDSRGNVTGREYRR
jgi:hypothetical protein